MRASKAQHDGSAVPANLDSTRPQLMVDSISRRPTVLEPEGSPNRYWRLS
jgi:hypothetical protein